MTVKTEVMASKLSFVLTEINYILNCDNISQYFVFYCPRGFTDKVYPRLKCKSERFKLKETCTD